MLTALKRYATLGARGVAYKRIHARFSQFTMIPPDVYARNLLLVKAYEHVPGCVVECGTWKGGMIGGIATVLGPEREYHLFDSFEGLPPPR